MTFFIILVPIPPMFILESFSFPAPRGIMAPNIFSIRDFSTLRFSGFLKILSPQKVKNMVTGLPMATAPLAMINAASALSISPSNTTIVFPLGAGKAAGFVSCSASRFSIPLRIRTMLSCPFRSIPTRVLPVCLHQDAISRENPISVAETSRISPSSISPIDS